MIRVEQVWVKLTELDCLMEPPPVPAELAIAFQPVANQALVISGESLIVAVILILLFVGAVVIGNHGVVAGIVDASRVNYCSRSGAVSALHFTSPEPVSSLCPLQDAFANLVVSIGAARQRQASGQRKSTVGGVVAAAYRAAARSERTKGVLVTLSGDKLEMTLATIELLHRVLGYIDTAGKYGAGTAFELKPPFHILFQPKTGKCWIHVPPETIKLRSKLEKTADGKDKFLDGYVDVDEIRKARAARLSTSDATQL